MNAPRTKRLGLAYALLLLGGLVGAHRFYLRHPTTGAAQLTLLVAGSTLLYVFGLGVLLLLPLIAWLIVDLVLLPSMVREANAGRAPHGPPPVATGRPA
jgi:TM2 domain-containing membrane protein YozV